MKRHPALVPFSDDHHRALVLARRLRRDAVDAELAREVQRAFAAELEPHFRAEELRLLPALAAQGCAALVERTERDHAQLRELVRGAWSEETARALGALLDEHVRFEERVLFPEAEQRLSEAELAAVRDALPRAAR